MCDFNVQNYESKLYFCSQSTSSNINTRSGEKIVNSNRTVKTLSLFEKALLIKERMEPFWLHFNKVWGGRLVL